jgi:hypothetical protein
MWTDKRSYFSLMSKESQKEQEAHIRRKCARKTAGIL